MIHFPVVRTARLDVQLRELTVREAVELAAMPPNKHEAGTAALLSRVVARAGGEHSEPGRWTVQERAFLVAHYIACTSDEPNFSIDTGNFLDYLDARRDNAPQSVDVGMACGDRWVCSQLTGDEAVAIESVCTSRFDWSVADVAARMLMPEKEARPDATAEPGKYAAWLAERIAVFKDFPESEFEELYAAYAQGLSDLHHLFALDFDTEGHIVLPLPEAAKEGGQTPARFRVGSCIGRLARILGP